MEMCCKHTSTGFQSLSTIEKNLKYLSKYLDHTSKYYFDVLGYCSIKISITCFFLLFSMGLPHISNLVLHILFLSNGTTFESWKTSHLLWTQHSLPLFPPCVKWHKV